MPSTCTFQFDRPEPIYYSGETINGCIQLTTASEKSVREVYIQFVGEAKVRWEERRTRHVNGKSESYTVHYRGNQSYLNTKTPVFGDGKLPAGLHTYTFCIPIPLESPTSCVEKYGKIHYEISLVLNRPFRFDNVFKKPMTIIKQLNLNLRPEMLIPVQREDIKYFCCWPCSSGPVISELTIPFGGFAPGQTIKYTLIIDNQSHGYDLTGTKLKLMQQYSFTASSPSHKTRYITNTLAKTMRQDECPRLTKRIFHDTLLVPPVPPSSTGISTIISVCYAIQMSIFTGGCHKDSVIEIPITIGTIPLIQSASNPANAAALREALGPDPSAPIAPPQPGTPDQPPGYEFFKPPTFEQATHMEGKFVDIDVDEHNRTEDFIPKYPMYTNFATPTAPPPAHDDSSGAPLMASAPGGPRAGGTTTYGWST